MNWTRIATAGAAAGIATWVSDFILHGMVMSATYARLKDIYNQTPSNPVWFLVVSFTICFMAALLFSKTRGSWGAGWRGGVTFGFYLGLVVMFSSFYNPLVIDGFPYYLVWCQGGITMIDSLLAGAVIGSIIKA